MPICNDAGWRMLSFVAFLAVLGAAGAGTFLYFRRRTRGTDRYLSFYCTQCGQKVRYLSSKAGRGGMCPRCGLRCTLPTEVQAAPYSVRSDGYELTVGKKLADSGSGH